MTAKREGYVLFVATCDAKTSGMTSIDQLNRTVHVAESPQRIVSTVPSQTELLADLGLEREVVGITKFCTSPNSWFRSKQRIGGTKTLKREAIASLEPDLILANKEENDQAQLEWLMARFPVWVSDVRTLGHATAMIASVGQLTQRETEAGQIVGRITDRFHQLALPTVPIRTAYLIWNNPFMGINADTFIHSMLQASGCINVFAHRNDSRYPVVSEEALIEAQPELVLLSSEPFPFNEAHCDAMRLLLPDARVMLADGAMFSWYGSRLTQFDPRPYTAPFSL